MASSVKALCVVSTMHIVLGLLSMTFGVLTAQISPYPYDGMFYMGVWMGAWVSIGQNFCLSLYLPVYNCYLSEDIRCQQLKTELSFCVLPNAVTYDCFYSCLISCSDSR